VRRDEEVVLAEDGADFVELDLAYAVDSLAEGGFGEGAFGDAPFDGEVDVTVEGGSPEAREDFGRGSSEDLVGPWASEEDEIIGEVIGVFAEGARLDEGEEVGLSEDVRGGVGNLEAEAWEVFVALDHAAEEARVDDEGAGA
jgi:hypothetical protein